VASARMTEVAPGAAATKKMVEKMVEPW